jgi:glycosyltransferase involved in cell wall biosynthesis
MPDVPTLPSVADQPLSVILLAHNDAVHLEAVVVAWAKQLNGLQRNYEIIVVDDGSTDSTAALAGSLSAQLPLLSVKRHDNTLGIAAALRTGVAVAKHPLLFYTTADQQYQPRDLPPFLSEIDKVHLVPGFRRWQEVPFLPRVLGAAYRIAAKVLFDLSPTPLPGWLGWKEHAYRTVVRVLFGVRTLDLNCAYLMCRREIFTHLPIQSNGPFVHAEILAKANFLGYVLAEEIPISFQPRSDDGRPSRRQADGYLVFANPEFSATTPATPFTLEDKAAATSNSD